MRGELIHYDRLILHGRPIQWPDESLFVIILHQNSNGPTELLSPLSPIYCAVD